MIVEKIIVLYNAIGGAATGVDGGHVPPPPPL